MDVNQSPFAAAENMVSMQQLLVEIFSLLSKLVGIYSTQFPKLIPTELLQYNHGVELFTKVAMQPNANPQAIFTLQQAYASELSVIYMELLNSINVMNMHKQPPKNTGLPGQFSHQVWQDNPVFHFVKEFYEINKKYALKFIRTLSNVDHKTKEQLHFYINNYLNMLAPTNAAWMNPEVIESVVHSGGLTLVRGIRNYLDDLVQNNGQLNVRMTDLRAFTVGKNLACTPGKVIFQNDLIQLIQYEATTAKVQETPIFITPPWINKYYVLDLSQKNSLVKWLVDQGFTVYIISWINPDKKLAHKQFEDYMQEGPLAALDVVSKTSGAKSVHMVGYCIGGTLLGCTLAYLYNKKDKRVKSATFLMSLLDFSDPGEIGVFLDEPQIDGLEKLMESYGYLNGHLLDMTFNLLRPNDLIWPYFINNYLLGKSTKPFDILYWNADSSNLSCNMYNFYLRNMYLHNNLKKPGGITLSGVPIDLSEITAPAFFLASEVDHITLWRSIYDGLHLLSGPVEFVVTESGHVRGVLNPPGDTKYNYRINPNFKNAADYRAKKHDWREGSKEQPGSWWPHWKEWLLDKDNTEIDARTIQKSLVIEDAPGSYVLKRLK